MPMRTRGPKRLRVSNSDFVWVVFKLRHGSEGVKHGFSVSHFHVSIIMRGQNP